MFSIPQREVLNATEQLRFSGIGGKRHSPDETLVDCALRESAEEIGNVVQNLEDAPQTYWFDSQGAIAPVQLAGAPVRPRLILEKRSHSGYGTLTCASELYLLFGFNAQLSARPCPRSEIAALVYLKTAHLQQLKHHSLSVQELTAAGAQIECQPGRSLPAAMQLVPHGTARFLAQQL